jgi:hypothetical protein
MARSIGSNGSRLLARIENSYVDFCIASLPYYEEFSDGFKCKWYDTVRKGKRLNMRKMLLHWIIMALAVWLTSLIVPGIHIGAVAFRIQDAVEKGLPSGSNNYNVDHIRQYVTSGQWMLLVAIDEENQIHGACTVSFINYPLHRVAFITAIGGRLVSNEDTYSQLKNVLKLDLI